MRVLRAEGSGTWSHSFVHPGSPHEPWAPPPPRALVSKFSPCYPHNWDPGGLSLCPAGLESRALPHPSRKPHTPTAGPVPASTPGEQRTGGCAQEESWTPAGPGTGAVSGQQVLYSQGSRKRSSEPSQASPWPPCQWAPGCTAFVDWCVEQVPLGAWGRELGAPAGCVKPVVLWGHCTYTGEAGCTAGQATSTSLPPVAVTGSTFPSAPQVLPASRCSNKWTN